MACMGLSDINKTIFEEYFENDTNLSNLNSWLITGGTNENCISVNDVDVLCNFLSPPNGPPPNRRHI